PRAASSPAARAGRGGSAPRPAERSSTAGDPGHRPSRPAEAGHRARRQSAQVAASSMDWGLCRDCMRAGLRHNLARPSRSGAFLDETPRMNKTDLIEHLAAKHELSKAEAGRVLETLLDAIVTTVKKGGSVSIPGFGSFKQHARAARNGVNPS